MHDTPERPSNACVTCSPPRQDHGWRIADPGYRTCANCLDKLRDLLKDVVRRWLLLDTRPGATGEHGRGAPGFGSRSPGSDHIIAMRDPRSKSCEVIDEWFEPIQLPHNIFGHDRRTNPLLANIDKPHREQEQPPRSIPGTLTSWAGMVAEDRELESPRGDVPDIARWLDHQLDYITRQDWADEFNKDIRALIAQLKPVTGEPGRRHIGLCPVVVDEGEHTRECGARLYAPLKGDEIECRACGEVWPREKWLRLGDLLEAS